MNDDLLQTIIAAWEQGESVASLQARFPAEAETLAATIAQIQALQSVPAPPLPERAAVAQAELLRVAAQKRQIQAPQQPKPVARRPLWSRRWVWAVATACLIFALTGGGVLAASASALPGDPLYGVKRWRESVSLAWTPADQQIARRIEYLAQRDSELQQLLARGDSVPASLLSEIAQETAALDMALPDDPRDARWQRLAAVTDELAATLKAVSPADQTVRDALDTGVEQVEQTREHTHDGASATPTSIPIATPTVFVAIPSLTSMIQPTSTAVRTATLQPATATNPRSIPSPTWTLVPTATAQATSVPPAPPTSKPPTKVPPSFTPEPTSTTQPPTTTPSNVPTNQPTVVPTAAPTDAPTAAATAIPPAEPTAIPTDLPSAVPTDVPPTPTDVVPTPTEEGHGPPQGTGMPPNPTNTPKPTKTPKP